jgi:hypothetical protein
MNERDRRYNLRNYLQLTISKHEFKKAITESGLTTGASFLTFKGRNIIYIKQILIFPVRWQTILIITSGLS